MNWPWKAKHLERHLIELDHTFNAMEGMAPGTEEYLKAAETAKILKDMSATKQSEPLNINTVFTGVIYVAVVTGVIYVEMSGHTLSTKPLSISLPKLKA